MTPEKIREMIQAKISDAQVTMSGENCNFSVVVTSADFDGKKPLERHRMVNDIFKTEFETGELHALSIKTKLPE